MPVPLRVLVVEDKPDDAELMIIELRKADFKPAWERVDTEPAYLAALDRRPDLVLADFTLPHFNAMRALQLLNERKLEIPFIVVSGSIGEDIAVTLMKQGAHDYLIKDRMARLGKAAQNALEDRRLLQERRLTEEALRREHGLLNSVMNTSPVAIMLIEPGGQITYANQRAELVLGRPRSQIIQLTHDAPEWKLTDVQGNPLGEEQLPFNQVLKAHAPVYEVILCIEWLSGRRVTLSINAAPLFDAVGGIDGVVMTVEDITERKLAEEKILQLLNSVQEQREELRGMALRLAESEETERQNLAHELHDRVGQNLGALNLNMNILYSLMNANMTEAIRSRLEDSTRLVDETVVLVRNVMADLHPAVLDDYGLVAALHWYTGPFSGRTGIKTVVDTPVDAVPRREAVVEVALFRIAQEAMANISKHAHARNVVLKVSVHEGVETLIIEDDGSGFDLKRSYLPDEHHGWGLRIMRERARAIGGTLRIETSPKRGTRIVVDVPMAETARPAVDA